MRPQTAIGWLVGLGCGAALAVAAEPARSPDAAIAQTTRQLEDTEPQLAEAERQLAAATTRRERKSLSATIRRLKRDRERLLDRLEELVRGPRVPTDSKLTSPFDDQLKGRQQHDEAIREIDVESRLPSR